MLLYMIYTAADWFLRLISLAILIYCVLTWVARAQRSALLAGAVYQPLLRTVSPLGAVCVHALGLAV